MLRTPARAGASAPARPGWRMGGGPLPRRSGGGRVEVRARARGIALRSQPLRGVLLLSRAVLSGLFECAYGPVGPVALLT
eukprot:5016651-Alexandrium_andersonii.AAC.1